MSPKQASTNSTTGTPKIRQRRGHEEVPTTGQSGKDVLSQTEPDDDSEWDSSYGVQGEDTSVSMPSMFFIVSERPVQKHELLTRKERDERAAASSSGGQDQMSADKPMGN